MAGHPVGEVEKKLAELGLELPEVTAPVAVYVPTVRTGNLVFVSGQVPKKGDDLLYRGHVGANVTLEQAYECARQCALNALAAIKAEIGSLDRVRRVVKLLGWVNSAPGFNQQPQVINGASELLVQIFGERGQHARSAVSAHELPLDSPVELEMIVEVE